MKNGITTNERSLLWIMIGSLFARDTALANESHNNYRIVISIIPMIVAYGRGIYLAWSYVKDGD